MRYLSATTTLGIAAALSAIPVAWVVFLTLNAFEESLTSPSAYIGWSLGYTFWWVGLIAAWIAALHFSSKNTNWHQLLPLTLLALGLSAVAALEVLSYFDPKGVFPVGLFAEPYCVALVTSLVLRHLGNAKKGAPREQAKFNDA